MTKPACPRSFEAEAMRDGRLAGAERVSFQRHLDSCPRCSREVGTLQTLAVHLSDSGSEFDADELHVRRERTRLLAAFDAKLAPPERTPPDGELEDIGTTFAVSAEAGRTTRVSVDSGSVVLRIRGQAPLSLGAGDTWNPSQRAVVSTCPSCESAGVASSTGAPLAPPSAVPAAPLATQRAHPAHPSAERAASPSGS